MLPSVLVIQMLTMYVFLDYNFIQFCMDTFCICTIQYPHPSNGMYLCLFKVFLALHLNKHILHLNGYDTSELKIELLMCQSCAAISVHFSVLL